MLTCTAASEHNFLIKSGLANMLNYFLRQKNTVSGICDKTSSYVFSSDLLLIRKPGLLQGARPLKERPGLSQGGGATHRESSPLTGRLGLSQESQVACMEGWLLHGGLTQGGQAFPRESGLLSGRQGLTHRGLGY